MTRAAALHLLTEFAPTLIFFVAGQVYSFFTAATILIIGTIISFALSWYYERRVPVLPLVSALFVVVFGLITVLARNADALIVADSIYYFLLAGIIGYGLTTNRLFLKWLFQSVFAMYDTGWRILSWRWLFALTAAGIANELVRILATPEVWIDFRFIKVILIGAFGFYQFTLSRKYRIPSESNGWGLRQKAATSTHAPFNLTDREEC